MPRQPTRLEHFGDISYTKAKNGYRARTMYRDIDGKLRPVERSGKSKSIAKDRLIEALQERRRGSGGALITGDTTTAELADLWLAECELDPGKAESSVNLYRQEINVSDDRRAKASETKIKKALGSIKVREMTPARIDLHIRTLLAEGHPSKAKRHRTILSNMFALAVRHDAIEKNPVRDQATIRSNRKKTTALETQQLGELRDQLRAWAKGEQIPGCPAFTTGAPRNPKVIRVADILLGTGARQGEVLGLRRCDIDMTGPVWKARISGTIVYVKGRGNYRQEYTKTGDKGGSHTVYLPGFAMETLIEMGAANWEPGDETLIFTSRNGNPWNANNYNRVWRQARGTEFAWVTSKTFRATVATLIAEELDIAAAAHQLAHAPGSKVTAQHYIVRNKTAPDSTGILEKAVRT